MGNITDVTTILICEVCGIPFPKTKHMKSYRRFCTRACYIVSRREHFDNVDYPRIWHNGKREYLHRVIWMKANPTETLHSEDIVHHKDENPRNRAPENLERIRHDDHCARAEHLRRHNYYRDKRNRAPDYVDSEMGF